MITKKDTGLYGDFELQNNKNMLIECSKVADEIKRILIEVEESNSLYPFVDLTVKLIKLELELRAKEDKK